MQVEVIKYKIQINGGYYAEASRGLQKVYSDNQDHKCPPGSYMYQYYKPDDFKGETDEWKALCANPDNQEMLVEQYPRWSTFHIEIYEAELADYAKILGKLEISETIIIPVHITGTMEQKQLEAIQRLTDMTIEKLAQASDLIEGFSRKLDMDVLGGEGTFNFRCGQMQPGNLLSTFNETCLLEDSCTDQLQDYLNDGWRIIACSPQPDSRRPDYVLGRYNINYDKNNLPNGAQRGH